MPIALLYHDVVPDHELDCSGFPGQGAARYKLAPEDFRRHMNALVQVMGEPPLRTAAPSAAGWRLAFDDGGSAVMRTADILEELDWRGHFFITTDYIDKPGFVTRQQLRDLHARGHVIGSHSCSHPRLSVCTWEKMRHEWHVSRAVLTDLLGQSIESASVPGGFYSHSVARAAAQAGYATLFNSEPTTQAAVFEGCTVLGRYTIYRGDSPRQAVALACGQWLPCLQQALGWNFKKAVKMLSGRFYMPLREQLLSRRT